jgi:hypothetical protein
MPKPTLAAVDKPLLDDDAATCCEFDAGLSGLDVAMALLVFVASTGNVVCVGLLSGSVVVAAAPLSELSVIEKVCE